MDNTIKPIQNFIATNRIQQLSPTVSLATSTKAQEVAPDPKETFHSQALAPEQKLNPSTALLSSASTSSEAIVQQTASAAPEAGLRWNQDGISFQAENSSSPIASLRESSQATLESSDLTEQASFADTLKAIAIAAQGKASAAQNMGKREAIYLERAPYKDDEKALKTRAAINQRYSDPSTSAQSVAETIRSYAVERGVDLEKAPSNLTGSLASDPGAVKRAAQEVVDKLFLSKETSFNPEKHKTVSQETARFLDLALQSAPQDLSASEAYRLVASNIALISYQDKAAAENMLGDHGVRHLLGHNIKATEQLADGLEKNGVPVGPKDRLILHQAMILHDLGYAMDSVRDPINAEGLKGQDAGHNVLAARYLKERLLDAEDPINKLFSSDDLETMHRLILYHDKNANGSPGIELSMSKNPSPEERSMNLETIMRVADNSHAFEDKLPELLYREPETFKTLRMMKTAGEIGDEKLVTDLKSSLASSIEENPQLAVDDKQALLKSAASLNPDSYRFSVGRIAGTKPTFDISAEGKISLDVKESDTHQQVVGLFGLPSYHQMEKFIADCTGQKTKLDGNDETIEGNSLSIHFQGGSHRTSESSAFNAELSSNLIEDFAFTNYSFLDNVLAAEQKRHELLIESGDREATDKLATTKARRRELLHTYRGQS